MAERKLRISDGLALPLETITESVAILAKKGAGKTYAASALIEEMLKAKLPVVVLDPMGVWWGLRSSADGKGPGFPIAILGGDHGDVPLEPTAGVVCADLVVDERLPTIFDLKPFSKNERRRFVADFLERLYQRNREALHVVLEEADLFAPEGKLKRAGDEQMLGAVYDIVRRGRSNGIGSTLITQRSASLSKEVLTQAEILIALRTTGPQDRGAIDEWIKFHGDQEQRAKVLGSLHELPTGEAWVWWPQEGVLKRIRIREKETFDSSATPKPGQARREPKTVADVDLGALREAMAATIEKAKAEDPTELRKRIRQLETERTTLRQEVERGRRLAPETVEVEKVVEIPVLTDAHVARLEAVAGELRSVWKNGEILAEQLAIVADEIRKAVDGATRARHDRSDTRSARLPAPRAPRDRGAARPDRPHLRPAPAHEDRPVPAPVEVDVKLGKGERTVLDVLVEYPEGRTYNELAFLAGYSAKASTLGVILSNLRKAGLVEPGNQPVRPTAEGLAAAGGARERPLGPALLEQWLRHPRMGEGERRVLLTLIDAYPDELSHDELCERTGYSPDASTIGVILSKLRKLGLVEKKARRVAAEFYEAVSTGAG